MFSLEINFMFPDKLTVGSLVAVVLIVKLQIYPFVVRHLYKPPLAKLQRSDLKIINLHVTVRFRGKFTHKSEHNTLFQDKYTEVCLLSETQSHTVAAN